MCDKICPYRHIFVSEVNQTLVTRRCNDYNEPTSDKSPLLLCCPTQLDLFHPETEGQVKPAISKNAMQSSRETIQSGFIELLSC